MSGFRSIHAARLVALAIPVLLVGCVERKLIIVSDPPGAEVYLDSTFAGHTPLTLPFAHYGTHDVHLRHPGVDLPNGEKIVYRSTTEKAWLQPPWYETTPIDFFTEHLWPFDLVDAHRFSYTLERLTERTADEIAAVRSRADEFRDQAVELHRTDPEGHTNPPPAEVSTADPRRRDAP